jgi:hypothetical protein
MTRESLLAAICFFIAAIPFAGIPGMWKMYATAALGAIAGILSLSIRTRMHKLKKRNSRMQEYIRRYAESPTQQRESRDEPQAPTRSVERRTARSFAE